MLLYMERIRKKLWNVMQPLTHKPKILGAPISDLFIWRNSKDWKTFFELTDIGGLFVGCDDSVSRFVKFLVFDNDGTLLLEKQISLTCNKRQQIDLSKFLCNVGCEFGTFSVFHSCTPQVVSDLGSYISDRGYVSYCYMEAPLCAYVHGNHDAIAQLSNGELLPLGGISIRTREYRLQHALLSAALYETGIVNHSSKKQHILCRVISTSNGEVIKEWKVRLGSRGCHIFPCEVNQSQAGRMVIISHLVMARPLIFKIKNNKMDVFHG